MSQSSALKKAPQGADRAALKQQLRDSARAMLPGLRARADEAKQAAPAAAARTCRR